MVTLDSISYVCLWLKNQAWIALCIMLHLDPLLFRVKMFYTSNSLFTSAISTWRSIIACKIRKNRKWICSTKKIWTFTCNFSSLLSLLSSIWDFNRDISPDFSQEVHSRSARVFLFRKLNMSVHNQRCILQSWELYFHFLFFLNLVYQLFFHFLHISLKLMFFTLCLRQYYLERKN